MPLDTTDRDLVFVGRIREDMTDMRHIKLLVLWNQVRKGGRYQCGSDC